MIRRHGRAAAAVLPVIACLLLPAACGTGHRTVISGSSNLPPVQRQSRAATPAPAQAPTELPQAPEPPAQETAAWDGDYADLPDLADWVALAVGPDPGPPEAAEQDDYDELVGPFDEKIIEEISREHGGPEPPPEQAEEIVYDMPIDTNGQVMAYIELFQTVRRAGFEKGLRRSLVYRDLMEGILAEEGLPRDLYWLGLIESAFNPRAYSRARAMGPWQFIESTGRLYGLTRDWWIDERRDPDKSTRAAARHLKDLYNEFGSWPLALAAYNAGAGRVRKAIRQAGTDDFWRLKLPSQTRNYVPAFMAAVIISKDPAAHGFELDCLPPLEYERVTVDECTDLDVIARCAGTSVEEIKELNPELRRWCTPPQRTEFRVAVPAGSAERFRREYALVPPGEKVSWRRHKIVPGDTLSVIAARYGTSVSAVKEVNGLSGSFIRAGDYLLIPVPAGSDGVSPSQAARVAGYVKPAPTGSGTKVTYRVRPGDSLWLVAQRHGVTVDNLKSWNPDLRGSVIHPGDRLTVWSRTQQAPAAEAITYKVRKGDTIWDIARRYGRKVDEICRANNIGSGRTIHPGQTITIPASGRL